MTVTHYGKKYALHIITSHFGDLVAKVCSCLLYKGPLTLQTIVEHTQLSKIQVKNSLLVLIQHNCVQAFIFQDPDSPKVSTQYMILFDNILHRMRFPKFLEIVRHELGEPCSNLVEGFLEHGRLTVKQVFDRAANEVRGKKKNSPESVKENLPELVKARYIERCPVAEPLIAPPSDEEAPVKKRGAKSAKMIEPPTLEQQVLDAAIPGETQRFTIEMDIGTDTCGENDKAKSPSKDGRKRKLDSLVTGDGSLITDQQLILWRVNFEEFMRRLRHKTCLERARTMMDDGTAIVLGALLDASRNEEKKVRVENSVPLSVNSIYEEVIKTEKGRNMTFDRVRESLSQLIASQFVKAIDDMYCIDFNSIIESSRGNEVESIVLKRYGSDAYKMFRLLSIEGRLMENDKIADTAFVEKKEAGKLLYRMWQDEYLLMEKLVVGIQQFLLWKVNRDSLYVHVLDDMFHSSLNLSIRLAYELEQQKEIASLSAEKRQEGDLKQKCEKLTKVRLLLESSRFKIDDGIMLFRNF